MRNAVSTGDSPWRACGLHGRFPVARLRIRRALFLFVLVFIQPSVLRPQSLTQRGYLETRLVFYPQAAPGDSGGAVAEEFLRYEPSCKLTPWLRLDASFEARADSHRQTERLWALGWQDRGLLRPAFTMRRLSATLHRGRFTAELGKQFIRWGKADILNPTDRFAPRDFLAVVDNDFLGVTAARVAYEAPSDTLELVWTPRFTPSRIPLPGQRWVALPKEAEGIALRDLGSRFPGGPQFGARWNHVGSLYEYSLSFFEGFNHLPLIGLRPQLSPRRVDFQRFHARMRMVGADAALPLRWFTVKGEAAYFTSRTAQADEYMQYVIQLERQAGEWFLVGGYAGEYVTKRRTPLDFAPDRGLARAFLARAGYTIDARRSLALETAVRRNGDGLWARFEYSQLFGQHWRATAGFTWILGDERDFLGQYHRNSHATLALRYSF